MEEFTKTKPHKVKISEYEFMQTLGAGSFGRVKLSKHKSTGKFWAIKILKKAEIIKLKQVDHIMNEVKILTMIKHPFLVKKLNKIIRTHIPKDKATGYHSSLKER